MKIVIFAGGTGSAQLQSGLYQIFGRDVLDYTVITNLGDNGLSTGECRKVMDGKIMGPSDLRKNQMLRAVWERKYNGDVYRFLDQRITLRASEMESHLYSDLNALDSSRPIVNLLRNGIESFFSCPLSLEIDYNDFSVSNIVYSGLAKLNNYSLDAAGKIFETILNIPADSVISSSDEPMYLAAVTESGYEILDEGDIVTWNNPDDKIISCHYLNNRNEVVNPTLSKLAVKKIEEADLIIFSSGTQWSSLIPTYISHGFTEALSKSYARKYLVMNANQDADVLGVSGDELLDTLSAYLPLHDINIITATDGDPTLIPTRYVYIGEQLINEKGNHNSRDLVKTIFKHYYRYYLKNNIQVFDYDDTLVARGGAYPEISKSNIEMLQHINDTISPVWISTGNTIKALKSGLKNMHVLADGGINLYNFDENGVAHFDRCLDTTYQFSNKEMDNIIRILSECRIDISKMQVRGKVMISIKPISPEYRDSICLLLKDRLSQYTVTSTGRTTIDVTKPGLNKSIAIEKLFPDLFTFVGDEGKNGNDSEMADCHHCEFVDVTSVKDTNMYLTILEL